MRHPALRVALVAALCAGGVLAPSAGSAPIPDGPPRWFSYTRPATYASLASRQDVPMRDGTVLACGMHRPDAPGRFPVVINDNTPYGPAYDAKDWLWAPHGYVAITCNPRGTMSWIEANKRPSPPETGSFSAAEQRDWYDLVEWLARQPWSNGRVGVTGFSYGGIVAYQTAGQRPPHLRAIIAGASYADAYTDLSYLGGARTMDVEGWMAGPSGHPAQVASARQHPLYDDMWRTASITTKYPAIRALGIPILDFGGWYDIYQRGEPSNYAALRKQTWLVMSGGTHLEGAASVPDGGQLAWMDHWLRGMRTAPLPASKVTTVEKPEAVGRGWQQLTDWPAPDARSTRLWLRSDGTLGRTPGSRATIAYAVNPFDGRAKYWGTPQANDPYPDQQEVERSRTGWQLPPLQRDLVVAGDIRAHLRAALSATDTNLVVRLLDVAPDGTTILVSTGWLRASHRLGHTSQATIVPGTTYDFDIDVWPTHWRFAKGHSVRISVSGGDVPRIEPDAPAGTVTVAEGAGGSYVELDVRP